MLRIFKRGHKELHSGVETWVVRWNQRHGEYGREYKEAVQIFADKNEAKEFIDSLKRANRLLGHTATHLNSFIIEKMSNGL